MMARQFSNYNPHEEVRAEQRSYRNVESMSYSRGLGHSQYQQQKEGKN